MDQENLIALMAAIIWTGQAASKEPEYMNPEEAVTMAQNILEEVCRR